MKERGIVLGVVAALVLVWVVVRATRSRDAELAGAPAAERSAAQAREGARAETLAPAPDAAAREHAREADAGAELVVRCEPECGPAPFAWPELVLQSAAAAPPLRRRAAARVELRGLAPGTWTIDASGEGWHPARAVVTLGADERAETTLALVPWSSYSGELLDAHTLAPIVRAEAVIAWRSRDAHAEAAWAPEPLDAPDGRFCLIGPPQAASAVQLRFRAPGYRGASTDWLPGAVGTRVGGLVVTLERDALARVHGSVRDEASGAAVSDALVCAVPADFTRDRALLAGGELVLMSSDVTLQELVESGRATRSSERGEWALALDAEPETVRILAVAAGYRVASSPVQELPGAAGELRVDLVLARGAALRGRVVVDGAPGAPRPLAVELLDELDRLLAAASLDDALEFELDGLDGGRRSVLVRGAPADEGASGMGLVLAREEIELREGETTEIAIGCGALRPGRTLRGRVLLPSDVTIRAGVAATRSAADVGGVFASALLDADGSFALHGVPRGLARCALVVDGASDDGLERAFALVHVELGALGADPILVDLAATSVEIECGAPSRARSGERIRVVAASPEEPALAEALAASACGSFPFAPGARYRLRGLPPGEYRLHGDELDLAFTVGAEPVHVRVE